MINIDCILFQTESHALLNFVLADVTHSCSDLTWLKSALIDIYGWAGDDQDDDGSYDDEQSDDAFAADADAADYESWRSATKQEWVPRTPAPPVDPPRAVAKPEPVTTPAWQTFDQHRT